ncbi:MAG: response regulator [Fuerstiella sp.]
MYLATIAMERSVMTLRVLFVDDDAKLLRGMERMLDASELDWAIETAESGHEALDLLQHSQYDVVVTDMQMPEMDGAELLSKISKRYPEVVRIILSGQADKESVFRAVTPMHQYLSKPCKASELKDTIQRANALKFVLAETEHHGLIGSISALPSVPGLYQEVVAEIEAENGSAASIGDIIAKDAAMTAKILQIANSAIFGLRCRVTSPAQALSLIGLEAIKSLVLSIQVFKSFDGVSDPRFSVEKLMDHSIRVATFARSIARSERLDKSLVDECFTSGLLHDVGKLILATHASEKFSLTLDRREDQRVSSVVAERDLLGLGHDDLGAYLLSLWGLPQGIVEAVALHHSVDGCGSEHLNPAALIFVANVLAHEIKGTSSPDDQSRCEEVLANFGGGERLAEWRAIVEGDEN